MKKQLLFIILLVGTLAANANVINFPNNWTVTYTIDGANIIFELSGTNKGYVAFGVGGSKMDGLDIASFIYTSSITSADRSYISPATPGLVDLDTNLAGSDNITLDPSSTYDASTGAWKIKATRPLVATDSKDVAITDGATINFSLALGSTQTWQQHASAYYYNVKFSSQKIDNQGSNASRLIASLLLMILFVLF